MAASAIHATHAAHAAPLALRKRMDVIQAFRAIAANCCAQIGANQPAVASGRDGEAVHQMRVGLRRLRSALRLFRDVLTPPAALADELAWLGKQLGPARDWDVLATSTLPPVLEALRGADAAPTPATASRPTAATAPVTAPATASAAPFAALLAAAQQRAAAARQAAARAVASVRYAKLMRGLERWLDSIAARGARLDGFAHARLKESRKRLLKRSHRLDKASPEARHRARIAAKRMRYAAEFFASLYPKSSVRPFVAALTALQDELGRLNDAAVADGLLRSLQGEMEQGTEAVAMVRGYLAAAAQRGGRKLKRARAAVRRAAHAL